MNTLDAYNGFITAGDKLAPLVDGALNFVLLVGPGLLLALGGWICLWGWDYTAPWFAARRQRRQEIRQLRQIYKQPAHTTETIRREKP